VCCPTDGRWGILSRHWQRPPKQNNDARSPNTQTNSHVDGVTDLTLSCTSAKWLIYAITSERPRASSISDSHSSLTHTLTCSTFSLLAPPTTRRSLLVHSKQNGAWIWVYWKCRLTLVLPVTSTLDDPIPPLSSVSVQWQWFLPQQSSLLSVFNDYMLPSDTSPTSFSSFFRYPM